MKSNYDLVIVTKECFPEGMASTNRVICYASEIAKYKRVLLLTVSGPHYGDKTYLPSKGIFNGIHYEYMGEKTMDQKPIKLYRLIKYLQRRIKLIYTLFFKVKAKTLILASLDIRLSIELKILSTLKRINYYIELSETGENIKNPIIKYLSSKIYYLFDGIIVISEGMRKYASFIKKDSKFFILPALVRKDLFKDFSTMNKENYFFYCSGSNLERDGFLDSLRAFIEFRKSNTQYKLVVASKINLSDPYHKKVNEIMNQHLDSITYLGQILSFDIPQYLMKATALLVTPHKNYVTRGFPTKLTEYLISGTPVICTSIDDLKTELGNDNVYMVSPNDISAIKNAMLDIVSNKNKAQKIGLNGRNFAINKFTMRNYVQALMTFLKL